MPYLQQSQHVLQAGMAKLSDGTLSGGLGTIVTSSGVPFHATLQRLLFLLSPFLLRLSRVPAPSQWYISSSVQARGNARTEVIICLLI